MLVTFSIFGDGFDAYNFLLEAKFLPPDVKLWDDSTFDEVLDTEGGFTLDFLKSKDIISLPFSLGRFLIANYDLLKSERYFNKKVHKSLSIILEQQDVKSFSKREHLVIYIMNPSLIKFIADLDICFYVTKLGVE